MHDTGQSLLLESNGLYIVGVMVMAVLLVHFRSTRSSLRLPPGPKPFPIIGNLLDFPLEEPWLNFQAYTEQYGDLVYLTALGRKFLFLRSQEAITDIIEKRSHVNERPRFLMLNKLMDMEWLMLVLPYGDHWRRNRKLLHIQVHAGAISKYESIQLSGARRLVCDLLAEEANLPREELIEARKAALPRIVRTNFGITSMELVYGIQVRGPRMKAQYLDVCETVNHAVGDGVSLGRFLVDSIPFLQYVPTWFPGAKFRRYGAEITALNRRMRNDAFNAMKTLKDSDSGHSSMAARMLEAARGDEQPVKDVAGTFYLASNDTTSATVLSFFLALLIYPEVQSRAQEELDRVVGRSRLPEFADKEKLPYLDAVLRECLRWIPVVPLGVPHVTTKDDEYKDYFIPKGSMIITMQWSLCHDPLEFPEPSLFMPERYLTQLHDGAWSIRADAPDPRKYVFGSGRRICPGMHVAEQTLFAIIATVLHTLDVVRAKDTSGDETVPKPLVSVGAFSHPRPFPYGVRMRDDAKSLVDECMAAAADT